MFKRLSYIILSLLMLLNTAYAQQQQFNFTRYTIEDGLAHNHCYSVIKDDDGFLWIATENGLSRFDGHLFKNYRYSEIDSNSIGGNWVRSLIFDNEGRLWLGNMRGGLNVYQAETDNFKRFQAESQDSFGLVSKEFTAIYSDSAGDIWYGTFREGFGRFDVEKNIFEQYSFGNRFKNPRHAWSENTVFSILEDIEDPNILYISNQSSIFVFHKDTKKLKLLSSLIAAQARNSIIHKIYMDKPGELWLAFWGSGLAKYNIDEDQWVHYVHDQNKFREGDGYSNVCLDIEKKSQDELWVACGLDGLGVFNKKNEKFQFYSLPEENNPDIRSGFAYDVFCDENDGVWICDQINGLYYIDPSRQLFRHVSTKIQKKGSREGMNRALDFDYHPIQQRYFVATGQGDGLYVYDDDFHLLHTAPSSLPTKFSYHQFVNVHIDKKGRTWVVDWLQNRLLRYDEKKKICVPEPIESFRDYPDYRFNLSNILEDDRGNLWISTYYGGLIKYNPDLEVFRRYIGKDTKTTLTDKVQLTAMHLAEDGKIWLGTVNYGVYIYDTKVNSFSAYPYSGSVENGLAEDRVQSISQDKNGKIWIGLYTKGIQLIDPLEGPDQPQKLLTHQNGLSNEQIVSIITDKNNDMWVQTQGGVFKYDYENNSFKRFTNQEGLNGYLKPYGFKSIRTGEICIGATEGFYVYNPENPYINTKMPFVRLTGFRLSEHSFDFGKRIDMVDEIDLKYKNNFFTIEFSALSYQLPGKNQYAYKLEGIDPDWVTTTRNNASYTNVREGTYKFSVKAANNDGIWGDQITALIIKVKPPWQRSVLAFLIYALIVCLAILGSVVYQRKRWQLKTQLKLKAEETKRLKDLDLTKSRIYANITHEFRTPLTVIQGMVEEIRKKPGDNLKERVKVIKRNSNSLLQLINQMLELSKLESGYLTLNMVQDDITKYIGYLTESFHSYANDKGIHLNFYAEKKPLLMDYDPEKIDRIMSNLISNALKFTREFGKVLVITREKQIKNKPYLEIEVQDNGKGISKEDLKKIFDRFFQADDSGIRQYEGTGIGLALVNELVRLLGGEISVESEPGTGSSFFVRLPVQNQSRKNLPEELLSRVDGVETGNFKESIPVSLSKNSVQRPILLIIEDNNDVVYYLRTILEDFYKVHRAPDGIQGIHMAYKLIPDIIISDVMMPGMDGFEVCETIKNNELTSHIPIIILTAKAAAKDRLTGLQKGADAYLMKPFSKEELLIRLEKLIAIRTRIREHYSGYLQHGKVLNKETSQEAVFIDKLHDTIESHLADEHFDVVRLCREMKMSRSQLHRKIKALLDTTPALYIRLIRLERAKDLLESTERNISEIAFETGFKSPSYFAYSFSETYGESPSSFRDRNQKKSE